MPVMPHCRALDSSRKPYRVRQRAGPKLTARRWGFVLGLSVSWVASPALGATVPEAVQLDFRARGPCGDSQRYVAGVERRTPRVNWRSRADTRVQVELSSGATPPYAGRVVISRPGQPSVQRDIEADRCAELLDALALVTALTLDPPVAPQRSTTAATEPAQPPTPSDPSGGWTWRDGAIGAAGSLLFGAAPGALPGLGVLAQLAWERRSAGWRHTPVLELSGAYHARSGFEARYGRATFSALSARAALCPLAWGTSRSLLGACWFGESGRIEAAGRATRQPSTRRHPWYVVGASLLMQWDPAENWRVFGRGYLGATLYRTTYHFEPEQFHETPPWAAAASVGLAFVLR